MNCVLIFDHLNDLIYTKYNKKFGDYIQLFAVSQGLLPEDEPECPMNNNVFIQIFSPIVTSHRIMHCQFGNSYTSIQFHDDLKLYFIEFMGHLFLSITNGRVNNFLQMCVTFARYLCGPDIYQLQANENKAALLTSLIDNWLKLHQNDQSFLVEAVEQLVVNNDLSATCLQTLKESISQLAVHTECSRVHALLLVQDKFLSLYSSANAKELSSSDILFTIILSHCHNNSEEPIKSYQVLLAGPEADPKCLPHAIHIARPFENVFLVFLIEIGNPTVSAALYETFCHLHTMQFIQIQRDKDTLQLAYENLDIATRKLNESLKKCKNSAVDASHKQLVKKWDIIKKKYQDYLKSGSEEAILRAETLSLGFLENLKELLSLTAIDDSVLNCSGQHVIKVISKVKDDLLAFSDFFKVKGIKNFSLGSRDSLTINKYMEEFPGLVHFLYIDRNTHRVTTPTMDTSVEKTKFTKKKIWSMVSLAQEHLQEGHTAIIWKDMAFTYGYFLWFEDNSGAALKATASPSVSTHFPGILGEDFYTKLKGSFFPKMSRSKVRCYELFCLHLGLITPSCMLEQARRLAATIWELKGFPTHAIDLL